MSEAIEAKSYPSIGKALDERIDNLTEQEATRLNAIENEDERLQAAGFQTVTVAEFLGLSPETETLLLAGLDSGPMEEMTVSEWDDLRREVRARFC